MGHVKTPFSNERGWDFEDLSTQFFQYKYYVHLKIAANEIHRQAFDYIIIIFRNHS